MQKKASLLLKITVQIFHPLSSFRSAPHEHSAGPCIKSMIGIDWDTWGGKRAHVPLQIRKTRITEQLRLWKGPLQDIWSKPLAQTRANLQVRSNYGLLHAVELALH